ncbi:hypothetical protein QBC46DRAFT_401610 [Diplogelasinospora grovesii]|uniref:Uncharacterized protein n=1 Tax=Diplogelasinospora grovesii TaxID=303347 RepID=A0AAN6MVI9_9PEZI|nr:hypothetical protein QBC46DRAFT_401610 [Diplogelasinospora grovesii]
MTTRLMCSHQLSPSHRSSFSSSTRFSSEVENTTTLDDGCCYAEACVASSVVDDSVLHVSRGLLGGIPLAHFKERWDMLPTYPCQASQDIGNDDLGHYLTGGGEAAVDQMTQGMAHNRIKDMAEMFHKLCPGDWIRGQNVGLGGKLRAFYQERPDALSAVEISETGTAIHVLLSAIPRYAILGCGHYWTRLDRSRRDHYCRRTQIQVEREPDLGHDDHEICLVAHEGWGRQYVLLTVDEKTQYH